MKKENMRYSQEYFKRLGDMAEGLVNSFLEYTVVETGKFPITCWINLETFCEKASSLGLCMIQDSYEEEIEKDQKRYDVYFKEPYTHMVGSISLLTRSFLKRPQNRYVQITISFFGNGLIQPGVEYIYWCTPNGTIKKISNETAHR